MRGEFLTAYTPYQAEVSQGYLQAIYEWQTYICLLTGMDIANASVYDGATAMAEAVIMAVNATGRRAVLVSQAIHPNYRAVLHTYARGLELDGAELPVAADGATDLSALASLLADKRFAAVVVQNPNFFGAIDVPAEAARAAIKASGTVLIGVVAEALSLGALVPPAEWGATSSPARRSRSACRLRTADRMSDSLRRRRNTCAGFRGGLILVGRSISRERRAFTLAAGARATLFGGESNVEYLYESGALRADRDDLSCGARRDGPASVCDAEC